MRVSALMPSYLLPSILNRSDSTPLQSCQSQISSGLLDLLKKHGDERTFSHEQLMVKLAEDRFTIAVLGQFMSGLSFWSSFESIRKGGIHLAVSLAQRSFRYRRLIVL